MYKEKLVGDLTQGKISRVIPRFVFPLLVANLLQQSCFLVDSIIIGNYLGKEALAAVSASFFLYYFVISLVIGVGSGISVVISHYYGATLFSKLQSAFASILIFNIIAGFILSFIGIAFSESLFRLTQTPEDVIPYAVRYFNVYIGGLFVFFIFNSIISVLRGMGDSYRPLFFVIVATILNIFFDILFVAILKTGTEGAAIASVIAQTVSVIAALFYLHRRHPFLSLSRKAIHFNKTIFLQGLKIGLPTGIQQCSLAIGLLALLSVVNTFGTDTLTAYGAAGKIDSLITQVILTLSSAMAAFCGQNIGAGNMKRARESVRFALIINTVFSVIIYLMICFFGRNMMLMFTTDEAVITIGRDYLFIVGAFFILNGATNILNGAMRGAGNTLYAMITGVVSFWFIRLPLAWILSDNYGYTGIWYSIAISITLCFLATLWFYIKGNWKNNNLNRDRYR